VPIVATPPPGKVYDHFIDAPVAVGLLSGATLALSDSAARTTTVKGSQRAWRVAPPSLAEVMAERSRSIAARLVLSDDAAQPTATRSAPTLIAARALPPTAAAQAAPAVVARSGAPLASTLAAFDSALTARARGAAGGTSRSRAARAVGAELRAGQIAVMHLPNAHADVAPQAQRPQLVVAGAPARVVLLGHGGKRLADRAVGPGTNAERIEIVRGTRRIVAIAQGSATPAAGLAGWHAGLALAYAGHGSAIGPGCVVHAVGDALALHRERQDAGWVQGAELARGESTVTTTFAVAARCVLIALDDPAAAGDPLAARQLLLGLDGATRAIDVLGFERAPVLLAMDNRSVLAYDVVPEADGTRAVVVTIASQADWSLVGVMASATLDATAAVALLATRGFDAALAPLAGASAGADAPPCVLAWDGAARSDDERAAAHARARGAVPPAPRRRTPQPARRPAQPRGRPSMKGRR
jgi:large repetitive protein